MYKTKVLTFIALLLLIFCVEKKGSQQSATENMQQVQPQTTAETPVEPKQKIEYYCQNDSAYKAIADSAFTLLQKTCIHIKNYVKSSEKIEISFYEKCIDYRAEKYGWKKQVVIKLYVPYDYNKVPPDMAGQTLFYYIGGGKKPGIVTGKWQAKLLCRIKVQDKNSDDILIPVAEAAFIK